MPDDLSETLFIQDCAEAIRREHSGSANRFVAEVSAEFQRAGNTQAQQTWSQIARCLRQPSVPHRPKF